MKFAPTLCLLLPIFCSNAGAAAPAGPWANRFFTENFGFRREVMSQFAYSQNNKEEKNSLASGAASRQSMGFEALKKVSSQARTWSSFDFQGRLVRRDGRAPTQNDAEGAARPDWFFEYHNVYVDFYDALDPLLGAAAGRFNIRVGRFYVPFGLNLQTDTHGTVLQLSNAQNFGFERDWHAGLWGGLTDELDYGLYYLAGSGYHLKLKGQSGLAAGRVNLAGMFLSEYGLEGGASYLVGERLDSSGRVKTMRTGVDGRWHRTMPRGTLVWTSELSLGRDASDEAATQLHQLEYLHASRRWGLAAQMRKFPAQSSVIAEATWYLRNDAANAKLHWFKLNLERQTRRRLGPRDWIATLQYYRYW